MANAPLQMLRTFTRSLSFKYSFYAGLIMFLAVVAFTYRMIAAHEETLLQERIQDAIKDSGVIKAVLWNSMMNKDREVIRQIVHGIGAQEGFKEIGIYDRRGVLHYTSRNGEAASVGTREAADKNPLLQRLDTDTKLRYRLTDDGNSINVVNPLKNEQGCSAAGCHGVPEAEPILGALEVNLPLGSLKEKIKQDRKETVIFAFGLFLAISTIMGLATKWGVISPIRRLQENVRSMARGRYIAKSQDYGSDELAQLAHSFDEMSRQINESARQLNASRRLFKELFEKVPCYLTVINRDFRVVRANQAYTEEFGDQVDRLCYRAFKHRESKCPNCAVEQTFTDSAPHRSEEVWAYGNDKKAFVIVNTSPIMDDEGKVSEVLEMAVDVTRLHRLQEELRRKDRQFKTLFENVPCYLTVVDASFRIAFYNRKFAEDFGDCWGKYCYRVYKDRDSKCENCLVSKTFLDGDSHSTEDVWHIKGEDRHMVVYTAPVHDDEGAVTAVLEMFTDITELKMLRSELATLGETIAGMSHDVKNILAGLEGGVYVLDSGLKSGKEDRVRTGWDMVKRNVERVSHLVKDILYASKEREPLYEECDPAMVLREVCELYESQARDLGIQLVRDFPPLMEQGFIDPKGIHSAVSNLISNALEACRVSSTNKDHQVTVSGAIDADLLSIRVSDDGPGMPEEVRQNLFRKFYSTKGASGTGLGLVVTRKIVEEHGGTIEVESVAGQGSSFLIQIPLKKRQKKAALAQG